MILGGTTTEIINPFIMFFDHENTVIITIISLSVFRKNIKTKFKVYRVRIGIVLFFGLRLSRFGSRICGWSIEQRISRLKFIRRTLLMRNQFAWSDSLHTGIEWRNKQDKEKEKQLEWEMTRYSLATIVQYIIKKCSQNLYNMILMWQRYNLFQLKQILQRIFQKKATIHNKMNCGFLH